MASDESPDGLDDYASDQRFARCRRGDARSALSARRSRSSLSHALERDETIRHHWASATTITTQLQPIWSPTWAQAPGRRWPTWVRHRGLSRRCYSSDWDRRDSVYGIDTSAEMIAFARRGVLDPVLMGSTGALGLPGVLARSVAGTENRRRPRPATGASTRPSDRPGWPRPPGRH